MSQHTFTAGNLILLAGYDHMDGEFFYSVFDEASRSEDPIHSSLSDRDTEMTEVDAVRAKVESLMPGVPAAVWDSIRSDALCNVGNRQVRWNADGTIKFDSAAQGPSKAIMREFD